MSDPYPIPRDPITRVSDWVDKLRAVAQPQGKPIFTTLQAFGHLGIWTRAPHPEENLAMSYLALVHGSVGLGYYSVGRSRFNENPITHVRGPEQTLAEGYPELWASFKGLNAELESLSPIILGEGRLITDVGVNNPALHVWAKQYNGKTYVMVVNTSKRDIDLTVSVPAVTATRAKVLFEGRTVAVRNGEITDRIDRYANPNGSRATGARPVHVYEIS